MSEPAVADREFDDAAHLWPEIKLSRTLYHAHRERLGHCEPVGSRSPELVLACACLHGDRTALHIFERTCVLPARPSIVARIHRDADFVDEALQELRCKLLTGPSARLAHYRGLGPLASWVRVVALRVALDLSRRRNLTESETELETIAARFFPPETSIMRSAHLPVVRAALETALCKLNPRSRNVLRMSALGGLSIDKIKVPYAVHRATVALWLRNIRAELLSAVLDALQSDHPELSPGELVSLINLVRSQLQISFERVLCSTDDDPL